MEDYISIELCEAMNTCKQMYPGQFVPEVHREKYPDPTRVGMYCTKDEFLSLPKWPSSWVHWKERCDKIVAGDYFNIKPVHYEGIFTLLCNMMCPHCTRGMDRHSANAWFSPGEDLTETINMISACNTLPKEALIRVIDQLASLSVDDQMGIVWGGGDPTMNPATYECIHYAKERGVKSSFITNGVFVDVEKLFWAEPTLVRISLNCCDSKMYSKFHGIKEEWKYYDRLWNVIQAINKRKVQERSDMLFGISLIVDERNITDFNNTIEQLCDIVKTDGKGIDYIIIRPVMIYSSVPNDVVKIGVNTKESIYKAFDSGSYAFELLSHIGLPIIPIKDSFLSPPSEDYYIDKKACLAYGMCGEIRYNGDVQLCSDSYGNPDYTIGNMLHESIETILKSEKRKSVLDKINENRCFQNNCPHNSRGHHLNRMFYQIEELRQNREIARVEKWIDDMRECTFPLYHSFFI